MGDPVGHEPAATAAEPKRPRGRPPKDNGGAKPPEMPGGQLVQHVDRVQAAIDALGAKTWETVKKTICKAAVDKGASNEDVALFVYKCKVVGVDPLSARAYLLPFKNRDDDGGGHSFAFVQGVEMYIARAQKQGDLVRFQSQSICQQDNFAVMDVASAQIVHQIRTFPRGLAIGAWCAAQKRGQEPLLSIVFITDIPERLRNNSPQWKASPALMLEKTAIKNVLRKMYPDAEIADFPEELGEPDAGTAPRVVIDAPTPEAPPKVDPSPQPVTEPSSAAPKVEAPKPVAAPRAAVPAHDAPAKPAPASQEQRKKLSDLLQRECRTQDVTVLRKALADLTGFARSMDLSQEKCDETGKLINEYGIEQKEGKWWYRPEKPQEEV